MPKGTVFAVVVFVLTFVLSVFHSGCGEEEGFEVHTLYCKVGGYYVSPDTPEEERNLLRVGLMGLSTKTQGKWIEVITAPVEPYEEDPTIHVAKLVLDKEPPSEIWNNESLKRVKYYKLELRAYLDQNQNGVYDATEPFVDGLDSADYDPSQSMSWVYFFTDDSKTEGATYGYNYLTADGSYDSNFEALRVDVPNPKFFLQTRKHNAGGEQ